MEGKLHAMYFSPTRTTQRVIAALTPVIGEGLGLAREDIDLTRPAAREKAYAFGKEDLLIFGFPVYAGRIPTLLESLFPKLSGSETPAVVIATYGNRDYDDALLEAKDLLTARGFVVIAAGAFIGEHSFSNILAAGRPDRDDLDIAATFAGKIVEKRRGGSPAAVSVKGNFPYRDGMAAMPFLPKTKEACTKCLACVKGCPMGVIDPADPAQVSPGCILCCACVKICPVGAKYFDAEPLAKMRARLEGNFMARKEPELFL
ncbi:MAG: ferredoxin [Fusobacteriaceae bacterium]|jgi:NAD-dependent dihydropyrimidine dehydrogenase PreA subunit/NAD(P)H-dependent FMN reductase|nr:ferredoxin [Fusobacteriaceae bacterium]